MDTSIELMASEISPFVHEFLLLILKEAVLVINNLFGYLLIALQNCWAGLLSLMLSVSEMSAFKGECCSVYRRVF